MCTFVKTHWIVWLRFVYFTAYKFYLIKETILKVCFSQWYWLAILKLFSMYCKWVKIFRVMGSRFLTIEGRINMEKMHPAVLVRNFTLEISIWTHDFVYTCISMCVFAVRAYKQYTPEAMSTFRAKIFVSKYYFLPKGTNHCRKDWL